MNATIRVVENGYVVRLVDSFRSIIGNPNNELIFKKDDLAGVFKAIDKFFLDGTTVRKQYE